MLKNVSLIVLLCATTGCAQIEFVGRRIARTSDFIAGKRPGTYARMMENTESPDARRVGINRLVENDFAKRPPYTTRYQQIARNDEDPLVRAVALRALNRSRDRTATDLYVQLLTDPSELVRLEAAKALINLPDEAAIEPLIAVVNRDGESRDVRIAAAQALKHYPRLEVARALVGRLNERDFGVAWQSRRSLLRLTNRDLGYDEGAWLTYLTGPERPFG